MTPVTLLSLGSGTAILIGLTVVLRTLGKEAEACPVTGAAAKLAALGVLGAFVSIGLGIVFLIGAFAGQMSVGAFPTGLVGAGLSAMILGIAFSVAATTLRDTLTNLRREARADAEVDQKRVTEEAPA